MRTAVLFLVILTTSCGEKQSIVGTWKLIADQEVDASGKVVKRDTDVRGQIIYTPGGQVSAQVLWTSVRKPIMSDSIMNGDGQSTGIGPGPNSWTFDQNRAIIDSYDSYFGTYKIDWDTHVVEHVLNAGLRPQEDSVVLRRHFEIRGDTLFLRSVDPSMRWQVAWLRSEDL